MSEIPDPTLELPTALIRTLSFADMNAAAITRWGEALPLINTQATSAQLMLATTELAALDAPAVDRLAYQEAVRPLVHYVCTRLERHAPKTAGTHNLPSAGNLLINLCVGYKSVVASALADLKAEKTKDKDLLATAIHRLMSDLARVLNRALQNYVPPPQHFWQELNGLFLLCESLNLLDFSRVDEENRYDSPLTIKQVYLRALLLASCKPNQLNASQLGRVFNVLELWGDVIDLTPMDSESLLVVDLKTDEGPKIKQGPRNFVEARSIRVEVLTYELEAYLNGIDGKIEVSENFPEALLRHLIEAWTTVHPRAFKRLPADTPVRVAVGMRASHYFLSGGYDFNDQYRTNQDLLRREINPFLDLDYERPDEKDPWSKIYGDGGQNARGSVNTPTESANNSIKAGTTEQRDAEPYHHFLTQALDSSANGYRIEWLEPLPPKTKVGELIALREETATRWFMATIRWLRQQNQRFIMGVELLSPKAIPVAIRTIQTRGGSAEFSRAFLLPAVSALGKEATIITPPLPFQSRQKVYIQRQSIESTAQLLTLQQNTESFNQFTFRMLDGYLENSRADSNIDSLSRMTKRDSSKEP